MKKNIMFIKVISSIVLGYLIAVLVTTKKTYVDVKSGKIMNQVSTFPFKINDISEGGTFGYLFPRPDLNEKSWKLVGSDRYTPRLTNTSYVGGRLPKAERLILAALDEKILPRNQRAEISDRYYEILEKEGLNGVAEFAQKLWDNSGEY